MVTETTVVTGEVVLVTPTVVVVPSSADPLMLPIVEVGTTNVVVVTGVESTVVDVVACTTVVSTETSVVVVSSTATTVVDGSVQTEVDGHGRGGVGLWPARTCPESTKLHRTTLARNTINLRIWFFL